MIHEIQPRVYDNTFAHRREPEDGDFVFCFDGSCVLAKENPLTFPTVAEVLAENPWVEQELIYLFSIDDKAFYLAEKIDPESVAGFSMITEGIFRTAEPQWLAFAGVTGRQLHRWIKNHRYCGCCGEKLRPSETERAFCCDHCGNIVYPRICPGVIVAVIDGDRLLMTRYAGRPFKRYALVAGFTEIGETLEETVQREVMEEVGLKVKNIRYFGCQPWSFSDSLLVGFFAELDGSDQVVLDENELTEASWFRREEIPKPESLMSLTSTMMEAFRTEKK